MLRSGAGSTLDPALMPGAMGEIKAKGVNKNALRRGKMSGKKGGVLATSVKLEPGANGQSVVDQLREILNKNSVSSRQQPRVVACRGMPFVLGPTAHFPTEPTPA